MEYFNFGAGPSMLPKPVLDTIKKDLISWKNNISILETNHRSAEFKEVITRSESNLRSLLNIPKEYKILFCSGGARAQYSLIPLNLLGKKKYADYVITGLWSKLAYEDATLFCNAQIAATNEFHNFKAIPSQETWKLDPNAAYVHYADNETVHGIEFPFVPKTLISNVPSATGTSTKNKKIPLVCDITSSIFTKSIDFSKLSYAYASAQKNMGITGITVVIIDEKCLKAVPHKTPPLNDFAVLIAKKSMLNTPPVFSWYVLDLMLEWIKNNGGVDEFYKKSLVLSKKLYNFIDNSEFFYNEVVDSARSRINIPFFLKDPNKDRDFIEFVKTKGIVQIKGHAVTGGMRASIYNAMPEEGVDSLINVMKEFEFNIR